MKFTKKPLLVLGLGLLLHAVSQAAIVSDWSYTEFSTWTSQTIEGGTPSVPADTTTLSWGTSTGQGQSGLVISNPAPGLVTTYVGAGLPPLAYAAPGSGITHQNRPITGNSLTASTLQSTLTLSPHTPATGTGDPGPSPINLNIAFLETSNSGTCDVTGSPTPCNDIFVLLTPLQNQSFFWDTDGAGVDPAQEYFVNIFPSNGVLTGLEASACNAVPGVSAPCTGFSTPEGADTLLSFAFTVSTEPLSIPEPGSLALAGIALFGIVASRRRGVTKANTTTNLALCA